MLVATIVGFLVITLCMTLAVQTAITLFERSVVGAAAYDAVRVAAGSDAGTGPFALSAAEDLARREMGHSASQATFSWSVSADEVQLTISAPTPDALPEIVRRPLGLARVTVGSRVRMERVRP